MIIQYFNNKIMKNMTKNYGRDGGRERIILNT